MKPFLLFGSIILLLSFSQDVCAFGDGDKNQEKYGIKIKRASGKIRLDGKLDEQAWQEADYGSDFTQKNPMPGQKQFYKRNLL